MTAAGSTDTTAHRRRRRRTALLWTLLGLLLAAVFIGPWLLIGFAFWAADGAWTFQGHGLAHWVFVRGSRLDKLVEVERDGQPVRYSVSLQEGNFPGWSIATYTSRASPSQIGATYAERCRTLGFKITQQTTDGDQTVLVCEIELYLDVEMLARKPASGATEVTLKAWGSR